MKLFGLWILILSFFTITACGGGGGGSGETTGSVEPATSLRASFNSVQYPVLVYLPEGYGENLTTLYPVLYVLDAEWRFTDTVNFVRSKNKSVIVVGIGNTDGNVVGRRAIDYRMPGARSYYDFLTTQVIPYIDTNYFTDPAERTLSGHSMGGLFTGLVVLLEDPKNRYFSHYLSQDGSFWDQPNATEDLEQSFFLSGGNIDAEVIIGGAELGDGDGRYAKWFHDLLDQRNYSDISLMYWSYQSNHSQNFALSMEEYIDFAY